MSDNTNDLRPKMSVTVEMDPATGEITLHHSQNLIASLGMLEYARLMIERAVYASIGPTIASARIIPPNLVLKTKERTP